MAYRSRQQVEAKKRSELRRERENATARLIERVPRLTSLSLEILNGGVKYRWPIVVDRAPALFEFACLESACQDGGHDLTATILRSLQASTAQLEGEDVCRGQVGSNDCKRVLRYVGVATFRK